MYRYYELIRPCIIILFLTTFISLFYTDISRNIISEFREINEPQKSSNLIVYQNAEGLKNTSMQNLQEK